jgi:TonB family protein
MSNSTELWKKWEGRVADENFPLLQSLGCSDHSAVFLTERAGGASPKLAIKLISADGISDDARLARWISAAKLSHSHLLRLSGCGRCQLDGTHLLYVVMEYAEENLAEILPLRPLSPAEASEMLPPVLDVLSFLHRAGYAHGRIKPSNIMAAGDQLKISADSLGEIGERLTAPSAYDAPELATTGLSPAADVWSLGVTLVTVLTQSEPGLKNPGLKNQGLKSLDQFTVPETIPQPLREITRQCLQVNPQQRCTVGDILKQLQPNLAHAAIQAEVPVETKTIEAKTVETKTVEPHTPRESPRRWILVPIVIAAICLVVWIGSRLFIHAPQIPATQTAPASEAPASPATQTPAPFSASPAKGAPGSVLHQVLPEISRSAQNTITGTLKVSVQVSVDASGNVSQAKLVSAGPSKYFADHALAAARSWKFAPPQLDGQATTSEWILRFQFKRTSVQVFPAEVKPRK